MKILTKIPHTSEVHTKEIPCPKFGCCGTLEPCIYNGREVLGCDECSEFQELPVVKEYNNL